jgi:hypothetical protein
LIEELDMNAPTTTCTIALHRSFAARVADALGDVAASTAAAFAAVRQRWNEHREAEHALDLDAETLRDVGAPYWMQEQARMRRESLRDDRDLRRFY